jgi:hypothetical protein
MDIQTNVAPSDAGQTPVAPPPAAPVNEGPINPRDAASALSKRRWEKAKEIQPAAAPAETPEAAPQHELADEANAAPLQEAPGETPSETDTQPEADPVEPPRSWTKEEKERFKSLPRETQEYLARRETERDREVRRSQNEAAEKAKAVDADREAVAKLRDKYEKEALPAVMQLLQAEHNAAFADIKTQADLDRLAAEDPVRWVQYQNQQTKLATVQQEVQRAGERQEAERLQRFEAFAQKEDDLLKDFVPELGDPEKAQKIGNSAISALKDLGFTEQELASNWSGRSQVSLRDHRVQRLIIDAVKYREGQAAKKAVVAKPLPPVQRPGVAQPKGAAAHAQVQALSQKLDQTGNVKDATALLIARRKAGLKGN